VVEGGLIDCLKELHKFLLGVGDKTGLIVGYGGLCILFLVGVASDEILFEVLSDTIHAVTINN